jgi:hypothetical protein
MSFRKTDDGNGSTIIIPIEKQAHFQGKIFVGTPPQEINALFDTGSADTNILGNELYDKIVMATGLS